MLILFRTSYSQHSSDDYSICLKKKTLLVSGTIKLSKNIYIKSFQALTFWGT